jgi:hypothetical protein
MGGSNSKTIQEIEAKAEKEKRELRADLDNVSKITAVLVNDVLNLKSKNDELEGLNTQNQEKIKKLESSDFEKTEEISVQKKEIKELKDFKTTITSEVEECKIKQIDLCKGNVSNLAAILLKVGNKNPIESIEIDRKIDSYKREIERLDKKHKEERESDTRSDKEKLQILMVIDDQLNLNREFLETLKNIRGKIEDIWSSDDIKSIVYTLSCEVRSLNDAKRQLDQNYKMIENLDEIDPRISEVLRKHYISPSVHLNISTLGAHRLEKIGFKNGI